MTNQVRHRLKPVLSRQRLLSALRYGALGLLFGAVVVLGLGAARLAMGLDLVPWMIAVALLAAPVSGSLFGFFSVRNWGAAARAVDTHYGLKDRTATALEFSGKADAQTLHQLQIIDALDHLQSVNARDVVPLHAPRSLPAALLALTAAVALLVWPTGPSIVDASPTDPLEVVVHQAERMQEELRELEEFANEHPDAEVEKLVEELRKLIEEMKDPGVDEREALAKLSEMHAAIQQQQAELNVTQVEAQMKAVGEALALAEPTAEAGAAMMEGKMEKAADELEQLDPPKLDRQTEKSMKEQFKRAGRQMQDSGLQSLNDVLDSLCESLGSDDDGKFRDAAQRLAGECRKQGMRKRLSDLLLKQCNSIGECKGQCESAGRNPGKGKGKGGKKWGLGASDNELADRTPKLNGQQERLTGQQSGEGEVEVETLQSPEAEEQARRGYGESFQKYEKLSEAVLESEPIPLGHRQTIRRYFESIRPEGSDK